MLLSIFSYPSFMEWHKRKLFFYTLIFIWDSLDDQPVVFLNILVLIRHGSNEYIGEKNGNSYVLNVPRLILHNKWYLGKNFPSKIFSFFLHHIHHLPISSVLSWPIVSWFPILFRLSVINQLGLVPSHSDYYKSHP